MKKILLGAALALSLLTGTMSIASAQTVDPAALQQQYAQTLQSLINPLLQEVKALQAQLAAMQVPDASSTPAVVQPAVIVPAPESPDASSTASSTGAVPEDTIAPTSTKSSTVQTMSAASRSEDLGDG